MIPKIVFIFQDIKEAKIDKLIAKDEIPLVTKFDNLTLKEILENKTYFQHSSLFIPSISKQKPFQYFLRRKAWKHNNKIIVYNDYSYNLFKEDNTLLLQSATDTSCPLQINNHLSEKDKNANDWYICKIVEPKNQKSINNTLFSFDTYYTLDQLNKLLEKEDVKYINVSHQIWLNKYPNNTCYITLYKDKTISTTFTNKAGITIPHNTKTYTKHDPSWCVLSIEK